MPEPEVKTSVLYSVRPADHNPPLPFRIESLLSRPVAPSRQSGVRRVSFPWVRKTICAL
jgi:hypothetical protein